MSMLALYNKGFTTYVIVSCCCCYRYHCTLFDVVIADFVVIVVGLCCYLVINFVLSIVPVEPPPHPRSSSYF